MLLHHISTNLVGIGDTWAVVSGVQKAIPGNSGKSNVEVDMHADDRMGKSSRSNCKARKGTSITGRVTVD
jgi:hypothetical protein